MFDDDEFDLNEEVGNHGYFFDARHTSHYLRDFMKNTNISDGICFSFNKFQIKY